MINLVRKLVAGPKKRTNWNGIQLDLTYISERIIAMAYPASGVEKIYRNSIDDVAQYFKEVHQNNYLIINVSMRNYQYSKFLDQYLYDNAENSGGVVAVHCNHGKGRTGTCIIAFMLYARQFQTAEEALLFYNQKRFIGDSYGVDQPCQRRYIDYTQKILKNKEIPQKLKAYKLVRIQSKNLIVDDYYLQISMTRTGQTKHTKLGVHNLLKNNGIPLLSDIFIELYSDTWKGVKQVARINYNLFFIQFCQQDQAYKVTFQGKDIKVNGKHSKEFYFELLFVEFCQCHLQKPKGFCDCEVDRLIEEEEWLQMRQIVSQSWKVPQATMDKISYGQVSKEQKQDYVELETMILQKENDNNKK